MTASRRRGAAVALRTSLLALALAAGAVGATSPAPSYLIHFAAPPPGSSDPVVGRVVLPEGAAPADFKLALLVSGDSLVWHRKDQEQYRHLQPGAAQAGGVLAGDATFRIHPWVAPDQLAHDAAKPFMRLLLLPQAFDLLAHPVAGAPVPQAYLDAAFASATVNRLTSEVVTRDLPGELGRSSATPAPTPSPSPSWTRPAGVDFRCICAPRLAPGALSATAPIRFVGVSRRGVANAVAVGAALTFGLALAGPADRSCPRNVSTFDDVQVARATVRIVSGYSGPAEDGLYLARGTLHALTDAGIALSYGSGRRQRLLLSPRGEGAHSLRMAAFLRAVALVVYRNELAGTVWQSAGVRVVELVFFDPLDCSSTVVRREIDVAGPGAGRR